jgi:alpha-methylacyl-CoA racemase
VSAPLHDVRIVELAGIGPGPFAAMVLAELGADVVRVERPGAGDLPAPHDLLRRSRRLVEIDLRSPEGVAAVLDLVARADILIEGFRPGVTERLGLGPRDCWDRNPALVYGRMTGWGQTGPLAATAGHDITYLAVTGALHAVGQAGGPPTPPVNLLGDFGGGAMFLTTGVLAALHRARHTGRGQVVDAAIVDGAASLTTLLHGLLAAGEWTDERGSNLLDGGRPWYDVYRTADDRWMALGALEPRFYAEFCRLLPLDSDEQERADPSRWPGLRSRIADRFRTRTRAEWTELFAQTDACVAPVLSLREAARHPQLQARGTFRTVDDVTQPAPAPRVAGTDPTITRATVCSPEDLHDVWPARG